MPAPDVLVVMPLYNARPYVRRAVDSILEQSHENLALLVINDGSTDGGEQEVAECKDERLIIQHQQNAGPGAVMNRAIQYACEYRIPFLARMDADDVSLPRRLELQLRLLKECPEVAACSSNCEYIDADAGRVIGTSTVATAPRLIRWEIMHGLRGLVQAACMFRTRALAAIGGYRTQFRLAEEVDLFIRLVADGEVRNCRDFLCQIRLREGSLSTADVRGTVLYQEYALDCGARRQAGGPELDFTAFLQHLSIRTRYRIWREIRVLELWRAYMQQHRVDSLLLAALVDPRRVVLRALRHLA